MTKRALKFTPQAMQRIAEQIGFKGDVRNKKELGKFFEENPDAGKLFSQYKKQAKQMVAASGGMVPVRKYQVGGLTPTIGADARGIKGKGKSGLRIRRKVATKQGSGSGLNLTYNT